MKRRCQIKVDVIVFYRSVVVSRSLFTLAESRKSEKCQCIDAQTKIFTLNLSIPLSSNQLSFEKHLKYDSKLRAV